MRSILILLFCVISLWMKAQTDSLQLSLPEVVSMAQGEAPDALLAKTSLTRNYWMFRSFKSQYKPQITFGAQLPNLNRSIAPITLPDGRDAYINRSQMSNGVGLAVQQEIALTGGNVFVRAGIDRLDLFASGGNPASVSYLSNPILVGFEQPLFGYNRLKWAKKIEPLRFEEGKRQFSEDMEKVALDAASLFFNLFISQLNVEAAWKDKINADTLYSISKGRFEVGRIAETELLQIELSVMNANASLAESRLTLQTNNERLRNFLGLNRQVFFKLTPPTEIPEFPVDADKALEYARNTRSKTVELERRLFEAEQAVAQAKGNSGRSISINGTFGLTQTGTTIEKSLASPLDQEQLSLGLQIPIADWGKARALREIAESNQQLEMVRIGQEKTNFEREVIIKVQQFDLLRNQVKLALRAYEVSQKRQELTRNRYYIGKIDITELNIAIREQDDARRSYMSALQNFWLGYYELRMLTLYDFEKQTTLTREK